MLKLDISMPSEETELPKLNAYGVTGSGVLQVDFLVSLEAEVPTVNADEVIEPGTLKVNGAASPTLVPALLLVADSGVLKLNGSALGGMARRSKIQKAKTVLGQ